MIVKSKNSIKKSFKGVDFEVLAVGKNTMITKMIYKLGDNVPFHNHPNEQSGYVISGEYIIEYGELKEVIKTGDSYSIPKNTLHTLKVIKEGIIIDTFSPPRKEYL